MESEPETKSELILYQTDDGGTRIEVRLQGETVWLSLNQMAELFQRELEALNLIVSLYLDFAELQARSRRAMHMREWIRKLDASCASASGNGHRFSREAIPEAAERTAECV